MPKSPKDQSGTTEFRTLIGMPRNEAELSALVRRLQKRRVIDKRLILVRRNARPKPLTETFPDDANLSSIKAARFLGVSHKTLANWRCQSSGPKYVKIGGRVVYRFGDLKAYAAVHTRNSTSRDSLNSLVNKTIVQDKLASNAATKRPANVANNRRAGHAIG